MQQELKAVEHNTQIWNAVNNIKGAQKLQNLASQLVVPSLILWCKEDRIFHVSGADELHETLPISQLEILNNCGHLPMLDKPKEAADLYLDFLSNNGNVTL